MIAPSISFDTSKVRPIWSRLSLDDVKDLIRHDVVELNHCLQLQAADEAADAPVEKARYYRLKLCVQAWERTQDVHWSWYKEILNARSNRTFRPTGLGKSVVGSGN